MAPHRDTVLAKQGQVFTKDKVFTKEVEPGVFVYTVDVNGNVPASARQLVEDAVDRVAETAVEIRRVIAARRSANGS